MAKKKKIAKGEQLALIDIGPKNGEAIVTRVRLYKKA